MNWRREWDGISAQIVGLLDGGRFYIETLNLRREDLKSVGIGRFRGPECDRPA